MRTRDTLRLQTFFFRSNSFAQEFRVHPFPTQQSNYFTRWMISCFLPTKSMKSVIADCTGNAANATFTSRANPCVIINNPGKRVMYPQPPRGSELSQVP